MCIHQTAPVNNNIDLSSFAGYDSTLDQCDYVDAENRLEITDNDICFLHLNIHRIVGKSDLLKKLHNENFGEHSPDVLLLCETWMSKN